MCFFFCCILASFKLVLALFLTIFWLNTFILWEICCFPQVHKYKLSKYFVWNYILFCSSGQKTNCKTLTSGSICILNTFHWNTTQLCVVIGWHVECILFTWDSLRGSHLSQHLINISVYTTPSQFPWWANHMNKCDEKIENQSWDNYVPLIFPV